MHIDKQRGIRLEKFIKHLKIKQKDFANEVKTDRGFVSQMVNGHSNLTTDMAHRISKVYPSLNMDWLLDGEGEMLLPIITERNPVVLEPAIDYGDPLNPLRTLLDKHESRIKHLESEMQELKDEHKALLNEVRLLLKEGRGDESKG